MKSIYIALILTALLVACQPPAVQQTIVEAPQPTGNVVQETTIIPEGKGRAVFTLSSTGSYGSVNAVRMTIDSVEVFNAADGWVTVNGDENTYDLLQLQGEHAMLADRIIDADTYTQVRMKISSVEIVDAAGTYNARLPVDELIINAEFPLKAGSLSTVTFDFLIDQGVRRAEGGEYVLLPVVRVVTRQDATIDARPANRVLITGGTVISDVIFGTNVRGETSTQIRVPETTVIVIENERIIERGTTTIENTIIQNTTVNNTVVNNTTVNNVVVDNTTVNQSTPWWQRGRTPAQPASNVSNGTNATNAS